MEGQEGQGAGHGSRDRGGRDRDSECSSMESPAGRREGGDRHQPVSHGGVESEQAMPLMQASALVPPASYITRSLFGTFRVKAALAGPLSGADGGGGEGLGRFNQAFKSPIRSSTAGQMSF